MNIKDSAILENDEVEIEVDLTEQIGSVGVCLDDNLNPPRLWSVSGISGDGLLIQPIDSPLGEPIYIESEDFWSIY